MNTSLLKPVGELFKEIAKRYNASTVKSVQTRFYKKLGNNPKIKKKLVGKPHGTKRTKWYVSPENEEFFYEFLKPGRKKKIENDPNKNRRENDYLVALILLEQDKTEGKYKKFLKKVYQSMQDFPLLELSEKGLEGILSVADKSLEEAPLTEKEKGTLVKFLNEYKRKDEKKELAIYEGSMEGPISSMKEYMKDISKIGRVTAREEVELSLKIQEEGDQDAEEKLIESNLRLVVKVALDFRGQGLPMGDLVQEGNDGLKVAVQKFDATKGAKFSSYAAYWIKQSIRRAISSQGGSISVPSSNSAKASKLDTIEIKLSEELGRDPTEDEIRDKMQVSKRRYNTIKKAKNAKREISLSSPIQKGEDGVRGDKIPDPKAIIPGTELEGNDSIREMKEALEEIPKREREILYLRYGLDGKGVKTLEEVSKHINRTRERVRQIQKRALKKLRTKINEKRKRTLEKKLLEFKL